MGLSRRKTTDRPRYRHIAVDLLDPEDTERKLAELTDVTHVFYAAFQDTPGSAANFASNTGPNREMLVNSVTAINRAAPHLKRVVRVTGTKYYGVHLGPLRCPRSTAAMILLRMQSERPTDYAIGAECARTGAFGEANAHQILTSVKRFRESLLTP